MPGTPPMEAEDESKNSLNNSNINSVNVRETTQTDHLNKKLLASYLENINNKKTVDIVNDETDNNINKEEEQNWET